VRYDTNLLLGILAIIAGILILWGRLSIGLVIGIYLIVWGILTILRKT
jgi:uncharacterized membrane protein HdeD (DUF308 family)